MQNRLEQNLCDTINSYDFSRRRFMHNLAMGAAGAVFTLSGAESVLAGVKDAGEITLDALMWTYVAAPLGTTGSNFLTPETGYSITLGFGSLANPDISLRALVPADQERLRGDVNQIQSTKIQDAVALFPRPDKNTSFSVGSVGGVAEDASFLGLCRPRLRFKGNGKKAHFRLVDAICLVVRSARQLANPADGALNDNTAKSWLHQYVFDPAQLIEPRFVLVQTLGSGQHTLTRRAEPNEPENLTATVTARIIEQTGFESDALKQAFAVGSDLELTYYSASDSGGKLLTTKLDLERTSPGLNQIYWDRVFKTFVIVDKSG